MQDHVNFFGLGGEGFIHHVHSSAGKIYLYYEDTLADKLQRLTLTKDFMIQEREEIKTPCPASDIEFIKWHRPEHHSRVDHFKGCLRVNGENRAFSIRGDQLEIKNTVKLNSYFSFSTLPALKGLTVRHHVQKGNTLYAIAWDDDAGLGGAYVFFEIYLGDASARRVYVLDSFSSEIEITSINVDQWAGRIYIAGMRKNIAPGKAAGLRPLYTPYLEVFLYLNQATS